MVDSVILTKVIVVRIRCPGKPTTKFRSSASRSRRQGIPAALRRTVTTIVYKVHLGHLRLAERVRFELTRPVRVCRFSRPVHSTALPPLHRLANRLLRGAFCLIWAPISENRADNADRQMPSKGSKFPKFIASAARELIPPCRPCGPELGSAHATRLLGPGPCTAFPV